MCFYEGQWTNNEVKVALTEFIEFRLLRGMGVSRPDDNNFSSLSEEDCDWGRGPCEGMATWMKKVIHWKKERRIDKHDKYLALSKKYEEMESVIIRNIFSKMTNVEKLAAYTQLEKKRLTASAESKLTQEEEKLYANLFKIYGGAESFSLEEKEIKFTEKKIEFLMALFERCADSYPGYNEYKDPSVWETRWDEECEASMRERAKKEAADEEY